MKNPLLLLTLLLLCQACQETTNSNAQSRQIPSNENISEIQDIPQIEKEKPVIDFDIETHLENYKKLKSSIVNQKRALKNRTDISQDAKIEIAKDYMFETLVDSIFPYWLGTEWDFNGYTETPRKGVVACGYFVSTTLRDVGIKLDRFKIAQKGAADIIKALCDTESMVTLSSLDKLIKFMEGVKDNEIIVVGLDFHVGFLFKKNSKIYFAHSNYIQMTGVEIELAKTSTALRNSNLYVVGSLTKNEALFRNWLN